MRSDADAHSLERLVEQLVRSVQSSQHLSRWFGPGRRLKQESACMVENCNACRVSPYNCYRCKPVRMFLFGLAM